MSVNPIPAGYQAITPYLIVKDAKAAIEFYQQAFGGELTTRMDHPDGRVGHAEMRLNGANIMLADEFPEMCAMAPADAASTGITLMLYVDNVDEVFKTALSLGAVEKEAVSDKFYGDRMGTLKDPFGHVWHVGTHIEDLTPEELQKRSMEAMNQCVE